MRGHAAGKVGGRRNLMAFTCIILRVAPPFSWICHLNDFTLKDGEYVYMEQWIVWVHWGVDWVG